MLKTCRFNVPAHGGHGDGGPVPCGGGGCGGRGAVRGQRRPRRREGQRARRAAAAPAAPARQERGAPAAGAAPAEQLLTAAARAAAPTELHRQSEQYLSECLVTSLVVMSSVAKDRTEGGTSLKLATSTHC